MIAVGKITLTDDNCECKDTAKASCVLLSISISRVYGVTCFF